jgi:hypothetical protein
MFISKSKARHMDESSCRMLAGRDGYTTTTEHQRQQQQHIYVIYGPPHGQYAWFAMPAMFRALAAEVW